MSLPFKPLKEIKIVTIDLWGTIFTKGNTNEIYAHLCKEFKIPFNEFVSARNAIKEQLRISDEKPSQPDYWESVINLTSAKNNVPIVKFTNAMNQRYEKEYLPVLVYSKIKDFLNMLKRQGFDVKILSNTGYLRANQIEKILSKTFDINVCVIGSDFLNLSKPNPKFYINSVGMSQSDMLNPNATKKWLHIGDSETLDIEPVDKLGGKTYKINNVNDWINLVEKWLD